VCQLSYRDALGEQSTVAIGDRTVQLGRAPDNAIVLGHESVSRHHAEISRSEDGWTITDLGSKNGIKINTYRTRRQMLRDGDRIEIGHVQLFATIGRAKATSRAHVVFQQQPEHPRAEVLDMDRLDSMFDSSFELAMGDPPLAAQPASGSDGSPAVAQRESAGMLAVFSQAAEALLTCTTLDETLDRILELVFANLTVERGVICLYDEETETTEPKVMRTREGIPAEPIVISTNIANDCIKQRQALLVKDADMEARFGGAESIIAMSIRSAMCAPLCRSGRVVGFVYVDQQNELHAFSAEELHTLSTLAILSAVAVEQAGLRDSVRHEQEIRSRLTRYSSPAVVDRVILASSGTGANEMVAEEGDVTVLFADLTGFTALAENLHPTEVIEVLNQVFERLTEEVFALEGTLDKFRGDGMMAFFGAPLAMPDHAARAVDCALAMQRRIADLNAETSDRPQISMRIGINSGPVVVGDIGSPQRRDYTVIGDVVNTASRLESAVAKPGQVVMGHPTWEQVRTVFECLELPEVPVKGRRQLVRPYLALRRFR
jgi:adenylate cyclase